jgi:hypothetical protein
MLGPKHTAREVAVTLAEGLVNGTLNLGPPSTSTRPPESLKPGDLLLIGIFAAIAGICISAWSLKTLGKGIFEWLSGSVIFEGPLIGWILIAIVLVASAAFGAFLILVFIIIIKDFFNDVFGSRSTRK